MPGIASLGLLAATRWNDRDIPTTATLSPYAAWRPETLQNSRHSSSSLERIWSSCCAGRVQLALVASMGRLRATRRFSLRGCSPHHRRTTAVHRRVVHLEYVSAAFALNGSNNYYSSNDDDDTNINDNYNSAQQQQQQQQQQDDNGTMVMFEIEHDEPEDTAALAVYGKLHRLLGTNLSRRLLGPEAVATMTSSNFLVVHHRHGGPWFEYESKNAGGGGGGSRLALGDRRWDICGIDRKARCCCLCCAAAIHCCAAIVWGPLPSAAHVFLFCDSVRLSCTTINSVFAKVRFWKFTSSKIVPKVRLAVIF